MFVTKRANNRVHTVDDQLALDAYLERLDAPREVRSDPLAFTRFALRHPLGLSGGRGEEHVRFIGEANFEDRSLGCIAEVPQGGLPWFMEGDERSILAASEGIRTEIDPIAANAEGAPVAGFCTYGEIARTRGVSGFHNQTLVVLAVA